MSYTIGIGVLINGRPFNAIRNLELELATSSANWRGLSQPPHVTVKRPFTVKDITALKKVSSDMRTVAKRHRPFEFRLKGANSFDKSVLYAEVQACSKLTALHDDFLEELSVPADEHEGDNVIFHCTLAMDLSKEEFKIAYGELSSQPSIDMRCEAIALGLFLGTDDLRNWVIIDEVPIGKKEVR